MCTLLLIFIIITTIFTTLESTAESALLNNAKLIQKSSPSSKIFYCSSFSDCERDLGPSGAICVRNTGQCVCEMGYEQVEQDHNNSGNHSTVYSCEKKSCSMPIDCTVKWGSGAHCSAYSCYCDATNLYDPEN